MKTSEKRLYRLYEMICEGRHSFEDLRKNTSMEFGVNGRNLSKKTVRNDLRALRDHPAVGKAYKTTRKQPGCQPVYEYENPIPEWKPQGPQFNAKQVEAMELAWAGMSLVLKIPGSDALKGAVETAKMLVPGNTANTNLLNVDEVVFFASTSLREIPSTVWDLLLQACRERSLIRTVYYKGWSEAPDFPERKTHELCPLALFCMENEWYLLASYPDRSEEYDCKNSNEKNTLPPLAKSHFGQYNVSRFEKVTILKQKFRSPPDFQPNEIIKRTFKKFIGKSDDKIEDVKLWFGKQVWPMIVNHRFHPMQSRYCIDEEETGWTVTFPITTSAAKPTDRDWTYYHLRSWILSWGYDCKVLEPKRLVDLVKDDIKRTIELYPDVN